jgi:Ser/Thr protein kinase RdoA (MazF antagonist)
MTTFPVTASTLSENELGTLTSEKFRLSKNTSCKLFRTGINHTYFIFEPGIRYVLRVYSFGWRSRLEILEEIKLLNLLKQNNISISHPISDRNGEFIQEINAPEGMRYAVLFSYARGGKVRFMNEATCASVGSLMAQIHNLTFNKQIERTRYDKKSLLELPYQYAKSFFSEKLPEMEFVKNTSEEISKSFEQVDSKSIQTGVVHLDIWYDNMSVTDEHEMTIFDFDFCGNGWLILDVAYFCMQLFHIETDKHEYERKVQSFINGYQSVRKLSKDELNLIPNTGAAIWIFYLGVQSQRFDWSNIFLTENYLKMYVGRMNSWIEYNKNRK